MPQYLQINIPESCHESWNEMLPNNQGRHCQSCQKTVVDFTDMTDAELINFFAKQKINTCGRFTGDQLQRDILLPRKKVNWMKYFFHFVIPAFLLSLKASAKSSFSKPYQTEIYPSKKLVQGDTIVATNNSNKIIVGKVVDYKGEPLGAATIMIKGTNIGTTADMNGNFKLKVSNAASAIIVSYVGFRSQEIKLGNKTSINVALEAEAILAGEVGLIITTVKKKKKKAEAVKTETCSISSTKIYPNPIASSGILNISWANTETGSYSVQITNLQGQVVQVEKLELVKKQAVSSINLKSIVAGTYAVIITNTKTGKFFSHQLIVQ
jgi:hypothetical protein